MDRKAGEVHLEALQVGDAYIVVWPDVRDRPAAHYLPTAAT